MPALTITNLVSSDILFQIADISLIIHGYKTLSNIHVSVAQLELLTNQLAYAAAAGQINWKISDGIALIDFFISTNGDTVTLIPGMPVVILNNRVVRATATSMAHSHVQGLITKGGDIALSVQVQYTGFYMATVTEWANIVDEPQGLVPDNNYFLSIVPGKITVTPPSAEGLNVVSIGRAISATELILNLSSNVRL